jgi:inositol-phosphate phosphatase/L-galactose 1-phosphate phosphatase/histidinol-phosphatase
MTDAVPASYVALAGRLADAAGPVITRWFRQRVEIDDKSDATPVTIADREAEERMRAILDAEAPDHGVLGEEHGAVRLDAEWVWVLDPIDGTRAFITGLPLFGTLIALCRNGVPVLGVIDQPVLKERWLGVKGRGATLNGAPISVRACDSLARAYMYSTSPGMFAHGDRLARQTKLADAVKGFRWGGDCYGYGLCAAGHVDLVVEADLKPFDFAALVPVIEEAGGVMTDWSNRPLTIASAGDVVAAGDRRTHAQALALLNA